MTRHENESIILTLPTGQEIKVLLTSLTGNKSQIGIEALDNINIIREELIGVGNEQ